MYSLTWSLLFISQACHIISSCKYNSPRSHWRSLSCQSRIKHQSMALRHDEDARQVLQLVEMASRHQSWKAMIYRNFVYRYPDHHVLRAALRRDIAFNSRKEKELLSNKLWLQPLLAIAFPASIHVLPISLHSLRVRGPNTHILNFLNESIEAGGSRKC